MVCSKKPKIVLVPYPAQGHVTPMIQLANVLYDRGFQPIIIVPAFIYCRIVAKLDEKSSKIIFTSIPDGLDKENYDFFSINYSMENVMPSHLELKIQSLQEDVCLVVVDLLASWAIEVAVRRGVPVAGFWPAMLATYKLIEAIPELIHHGYISEFGIPRNQDNICCLPGRPLLTTRHLPWLIGNPSSQKQRFMFWVRILERSRNLKWLLANSFMEDNFDDISQINRKIDSVQRSSDRPRIFRVGPLTGHDTKLTKALTFWDEDRSCLDWLAKQKKSSVIYVSFGSWVGPIGEQKVTELALGLENTKSPFIWVLGSTWRDGLPDGFLDRVRNIGKIISWAPQKELLEHPAVGCYLTHCGWNSTVEAIQCGKKLLCYPVAGDQFVNCTYIVDVWGIGAKMNGIRKSDVEEGVMRVMKGKGSEEMEEKVMKLKARLNSEELCSRAVSNLTDFLDQINNSMVDDSPNNFMLSL
ncbi:UDP-glycosyltransferase 82A1-like [Papaver somniferum]|uniref:UDP-glycosyltransferase 82A1-like n=1 Tax=Papaver somniferum TaxID=3469 RepID=UPI000E704D22|nr:UDP-glycosyltransferase 82A1-like [Papaver somniferum]